MINGIIVIKEHRKQYKSVEKQGLLSLILVFMEQTQQSYTLFLYLCFYLPFTALLYFSLFLLAGFTMAMEEHPLQAVRHQQTCIRKH